MGASINPSLWWNLLLSFPFLLKSRLSLHFSVEVFICSSLSFFLLKSLLSLHFPFFETSKFLFTLKLKSRLSLHILHFLKTLYFSSFRLKSLLSFYLSFAISIYFLTTFLLKSLLSLYFSIETSMFSLFYCQSVHFHFTLLLKYSTFSSIFFFSHWNVYFVFTLIWKSLTFSSLFCINIYFLFSFSIEKEIIYVHNIRIYIFRQQAKSNSLKEKRSPAKKKRTLQMAASQRFWGPDLIYLHSISSVSIQQTSGNWQESAHPTTKRPEGNSPWLKEEQHNRVRRTNRFQTIQNTPLAWNQCLETPAAVSTQFTFEARLTPRSCKKQIC